ncbi:MAG: response regulator transcription factor [Chloroflexota bacterium]|nr:response regulator transcription factor [Chloroflexota bacterium]
MAELRIIVAGGAPLLQAGIVAALAADERLRLVAQVEDVQQAQAYVLQGACDVLVLNTDSPHVEAADVIAGDATGSGEGGDSRTSAINATCGGSEPVKVLVLTDDDSRHELLASLRVGVQGYGIRSRLQPEDIRAAVRTVAGGRAWLCPVATGHLVQLAVVDSGNGTLGSRTSGPLSPREAEVLRLAADGDGEDQIAVALCLSKNTVKTYLRRIREKLQVTSRGEAVRIGFQHGLISSRRHTGAA